MGFLFFPIWFTKRTVLFLFRAIPTGTMIVRIYKNQHPLLVPRSGIDRHIVAFTSLACVVAALFKKKHREDEASLGLFFRQQLPYSINQVNNDTNMILNVTINRIYSHLKHFVLSANDKHAVSVSFFCFFFLTRCALRTLEQQPNSDSVIVRKMHHRCHQEGRTISRQAYNRHIVGIDLNKNKTVRFARRCVFNFRLISTYFARRSYISQNVAIC